MSFQSLQEYPKRKFDEEPADGELGFQSLQEYPKPAKRGLLRKRPVLSFQSLQEYPKQFALWSLKNAKKCFQSLQEYPKQDFGKHKSVTLICFQSLQEYPKHALIWQHIYSIF